jgi:hypothetical protein
MTSPATGVVFHGSGVRPHSNAGATALYAADPAILLTPRYAHPRNSAQAAAVDALGIALGPSAAAQALFGDADLGWAYRVFDWADWGGAEGPDAPPPGCLTAEERAAQLDAAQGEPAPRRRILLFNVIVALEWAPDRAYLLQLQWAFRRASDFLYDATDGLMAFGQVVIGGPELLDCADIQIMASNRLHPRSWVGGLLDAAKYQPIRVGRGIWHDRNQVTMPWDEPEGYRTLIHEWCHYALSLMDGYIERRTTESGEEVVVPTIQMTSTSIMESLEGTSELFSQAGVRSSAAREDAWSVIAAQFPELLPSGTPPAPPLNGPARLPLPLPLLRATAGLPSQEPPALLPIQAGSADGPAGLLAANLPESAALADFFRGSRLDLRQAIAGRVWVHVLRRNADNELDDALAQGTLDAGAVEEPFRLYGARPGDIVHLTYESPMGGSLACAAELHAANGRAVPGPWRLVRTQNSLADLVPILPRGHVTASQLLVRVDIHSRRKPSAAFLAQQGRVDSSASGRVDLRSKAPVPIQRLDGHLLLRWPNGAMTIGAYSHGGGPPTHGGISPGLDGGVTPLLGGGDVPASNVKTPITAGSSDGRVMIFFDPFPLETDPAAVQVQQRYYESVRVVTMALHGVDLPPPSAGYVPASGLYSIAASRPLPADLNPTLVINLNPMEIRPGRQAAVYFWLDDEWHELSTDAAPACRRYVYLALRGTRLAAEVSDYAAALRKRAEPRVVAVRVFWKPAA